MPHATRRGCDFPGCDRGEPDADGNATPYATSEGLHTRDEVSTDLQGHVFRAHELLLRHAEAAVAKVQADTEKIQAETARVVAQQINSGAGPAGTSHTAGNRTGPQSRGQEGPDTSPTGG